MLRDKSARSAGIWGGGGFEKCEEASHPEVNYTKGWMDHVPTDICLCYLSAVLGRVH